MQAQTRIDRLEDRVQELSGELQALRKSWLEDLHALPPNLIRNSWMDLLNDTVPAGFDSVRSNLVLEAVHPYTKGFEGPYTPREPDSHADSVDAATGEQPYWFGVYHKGTRVARGGLADGWHSFTNGHILKITGDNTGDSTSVIFPFERNALVRRVRFTA